MPTLSGYHLSSEQPLMGWRSFLEHLQGVRDNRHHPLQALLHSHGAAGQVDNQASGANAGHGPTQHGERGLLQGLDAQRLCDARDLDVYDV